MINIDNLHCPYAYTQYSFLMDQGAFKACCTATRYQFDPDLYEMLGDDYFIKHPNLQIRKKNLLKNIKHEDCKECWDKETLQKNSLRIEALVNKDDYFITNDRNVDPGSARVNKIELMMSNVCNLGCFMCTPHSSSTIEKIWNLDSNFNKANQISIQKNSTYSRLYKQKFSNSVMGFIKNAVQDTSLPECSIAYLGGEPTLHTEMFDHADLFIEWARPAIIAGKQLRIEIVTNGTGKPIINERCLAMFKKYKDAGWTTRIRVSIDGVDQYAQVRHGVNFDQVKDNFLYFISSSYIDELFAAVTMSNLTIPYVDLLADYLYSVVSTSDIASKKVNVSINSVNRPSWMNYQYLPRKYATDALLKAVKTFTAMRNTYGIGIDIDNLMDIHRIRIPESVDVTTVNKFFNEIHAVQTLYQKTYPEWNFYKNFPHLIVLAKDYNINITDT